MATRVLGGGQPADAAADVRGHHGGLREENSDFRVAPQTTWPVVEHSPVQPRHRDEENDRPDTEQWGRASRRE